jgi:hypothetical protein
MALLLAMQLWVQAMLLPLDKWVWLTHWQAAFKQPQAAIKTKRILTII